MTVSATRKIPKKATPTAVSGTVDEKRTYLTEPEVDALMKAAKTRGRYGHRDATMILLAYRHGLRAGELVNLRWAQLNMKTGHIRVLRLKGSDESLQPLSGTEMRALRPLEREANGGRYVFTTERGGKVVPMTTNGFGKMLRRAAVSIGMVDVHPHLLRHGTGFKLVNQGVDTRTLAAYLGHRKLQNTARYTKMDARRFDGFWKD
jgi:integrase